MSLNSAGGPFRAVAETVVPEAVHLHESEWAGLVAVVEGLLLSRDTATRRQILLFLNLLNWMPLFRYGRRFVSLDASRRTRFLSALQNSGIRLLRIGFWGLRTLVFMGYYGRAGGAEAVGYRPDPRGWEAVR